MKLSQSIALTAAAAAITAVSIAAQARPNFSGTWEINGEKTAAARAAAATPSAQSTAPAARMGGGGLRAGGSGGGNMIAASGGAPAPYLLRQTDRDLTITRVAGDGTEQKWIYKLDGSESVNTNARTTLTTQSKFVDGKLVTEGRQVTKTDQAETSGTFKEVRWLDKDGSLHVETTRVINGGAAFTGVQVFDKKK